MTTTTIDDPAKTDASSARSPICEARGVSVNFGDDEAKLVLKDVSLR